MQSTGKEKFTVYVYVKTQLYNMDEPWSDSDSECISDEAESGEDSSPSDSSLDSPVNDTSE